MFSLSGVHAQRELPAPGGKRRLRGTVHPLVASQYDAGPVESSFPLSVLTLYLRTTGDPQHLLAEQRDLRSVDFHRWLTPEEYGARFGPALDEIAKLKLWLESEGFTVAQVARGRGWITFGGNAAQVAHAFGASIRRYRVNGKTHYANAEEISIPETLAALVLGVGGLEDFSTLDQPALRIPLPEYNSGNLHYLAPDDLAMIYNIAPMYREGYTGSGQKIVIVGQSTLLLSDMTSFRRRFNLSAQDLQVVRVPNLSDPGLTASYSEAAADIQWAGAVARDATIIYVYSTSAFVALQYAIDQNLAPVVSASYSFGCEAQVTAAAMVFYQQIAQQANAQGITWVNSSGDAGAASCDSNGSPIAHNGFAVRFPSSIPEVTAVGGTQFDEQTGTYWNATNDNNGASALSYIPEKVWNESADVKALWAGGGGRSSFFPKPPWQSGPGVPDDGLRDTPDIAMSAALHDGYYAVIAGSAVVFSGTSAAAPSFAGMLAILNQYLAANSVQTRPGLGNVNPALYQLARDAPEVFHDITVGHNRVPCASGSAGCQDGVLGFSAGPGYDLGTGLGSPDFSAIVHRWTSAPAASQVVVSFSNNPVYQQAPNAGGFSWFVTVTLTEESGTATNLTGFTVDGQDNLNLFAKRNIDAFGKMSTSLGFKINGAPRFVRFAFTGQDADGQTWARQSSIQFLGSAPAPVIRGVAHGASFEQTFAPGMVLSVFGTDLAANPQAAAAVPLPGFLGRARAVINNIIAPLYYVSPTQLNVQIPYEIQPGTARLTITNGPSVSAGFTFQVAASAPGIFTDGNGALVPLASAARGSASILFTTGEGMVAPALRTGSSPTPNTSISRLPTPVLPVKLSIGGVDAEVLFAGIPSGLVGVTQVNFRVPAEAPLGRQPVVLTVGDAASVKAFLTITE